MKYTDPKEENVNYYAPDETIRLRVSKPEIGDMREIDIMPRDLDVVKNSFIQQGYQVTPIASDKTSTLGTFLGGVLQGASLSSEEELYGVIGGDEVQKEAEKQRQREMEERPLARIGGEVVGSLIGAPARIEAATAKAASKLGPVASRAVGALKGGAEGAVETVASKPMGEKEDITWGDIVVSGIGAALGGLLPPKNVKVDKRTINSVKENVKDAYEEGNINIEQAKQLVDQLDELDVAGSIVYIDPKKLQTQIEEANKKGLPVFQYREKPPLVREDPNNMWDRWRHSATTFFIKEKQEVPPSILQYIVDNVSTNKLPRETLDQASGVMKIPREETVAWLQKVSGSLPTKPLDQLGRQRMKTLFGLNDEQINKINSFFQNAGEDLRILGGNRVNVGSPSPQDKIIGEPFRRQGMFGSGEKPSLEEEMKSVGLTIGDQLGAGSQNKVYRATTPEGRQIAVKWGSMNENPMGYFNLVRKEIPIVENIRKIKQEGVLSAKESAILPDFDFEKKGKIALLKSKPLLPLLPDDADEIRQIIPETITKDTPLPLSQDQIFNPRVFELAQSLEGLKRVTNKMDSISPSNLMLDPDLDKIVIVDIGDIDFKPIEEIKKIKSLEEEATSLLLGTEQARKQFAGQPITQDPVERVELLRTLKGIDPKYIIPQESEQLTLQKVIPELGVKPVFTTGNVWDPLTDLKKPGITSYIGSGWTADVYGVLPDLNLPKITTEQIEKGTEKLNNFLSNIGSGDLEKQIKQAFNVSADKIKPGNEGLLVSSGEYVVKIPNRSRRIADMRNMQDNEVGVRLKIEEVRNSNILPPEVMDHFVPSRNIDYQDPIDRSYYTAYVMPKLKPLPRGLDFEMNRGFPGSHDPAKYMGDPFDPQKIAKLHPKLQELLNALIQAKDKAGILWDDLHGGNVMWDPVKQKIVVIDPGHFRIKNISQPAPSAATPVGKSVTSPLLPSSNKP